MSYITNKNSYYYWFCPEYAIAYALPATGGDRIVKHHGGSIGYRIRRSHYNLALHDWWTFMEFESNRP